MNETQTKAGLTSPTEAQEREGAGGVTGLMELVSEYGRCRWSEGSSGATYLDRAGERRSREEAADLYRQIKAYAARLAGGVGGRDGS